MKRSGPVFNWCGTDRQGNAVSGTTRCKGPRDLKLLLLRQGILVISVRKQRQISAASLISSLRATQPPHPDKVRVMLQQLSNLHGAGLPLMQALKIIAEATPDLPMQRLMSDLQTQVGDGGMLHEAMRRHGNSFDPLSISLIASAESSGSLDTVLPQIVSNLQRQAETARKVNKALQYPIIIMGVAILVTSLLLTRVIPQFAATFASLDAELPALTQALIYCSELSRRYGLWLLLSMLVAGATASQCWQRSAQLQYLTASTALKLPVIGKLVTAAVLERLCRTLATTLRSGLPIIQALADSRQIAANPVFKKALESAINSIHEGESLYNAIHHSDRFPVMMAQMIHAGEQSGTLDSMLDKCAEYYRQELDSRITLLTSLIEPALMALLGLVVGGVMLAMYLPVFSLGSLL
jgi:type IV pilus assembly protein PilC